MFSLILSCHCKLKEHNGEYHLNIHICWIADNHTLSFVESNDPPYAKMTKHLTQNGMCTYSSKQEKKNQIGRAHV